MTTCCGSKRFVGRAGSTFHERRLEQEVTYVAEVGGRLIVIERVPARVCLETGGKHYSPETVERIQAIIWGRTPPSRTISAPVYEFPDLAASPANSSKS
jgi:YgiT-type zinc finger domain-containing protein